MFAKINHVAIVSQQYALLANFYQSLFGMRTSKSFERTVRAITVGDGYVGLNINPRKAGRPAGLDHFGVEVEDGRRGPRVLLADELGEPVALFDVDAGSGVGLLCGHRKLLALAVCALRGELGLTLLPLVERLGIHPAEAGVTIVVGFRVVALA